MPDRPFEEFIGESLALIRQECPQAHRSLWFALLGVVINLCVDDEDVTIQGERSGPVVAEFAPGDVSVFASHVAILSLIDGEQTLSEAVWSGRIDLLGAASTVARFHDALIAYVHGAVRSRSHPGLLRRYRTQRSEDP